MAIKRSILGAFSDLVGETCELEKIETLKERFGLDVGEVRPFGLLMGIADVYFDESINNCSDVVIGCGLPNESIRMKLKDLVSLVHPKIVRMCRCCTIIARVCYSHTVSII